MTRADPAPALDPPTVPVSLGHTPIETAPRLADGIELVGRYQGSGYREPRFLAIRADGQVVQLTDVLYRLAGLIDGRRDHGELASALEGRTGRTVAPDDVANLIEHRLAPAGLIDGDDDTDTVRAERPDPLLQLRFRLPLVSDEVSWRIAGIFRPAFRPVAVVLGLAAFVGLDVLALAGGGIAQLGPSALVLVDRPVLGLLVIAVMLAAGAVHECGHVAACRYGGARPGAMGVGIYLVWPAYFSTVTDSYRLSRAGRLRVDLGGVYFNALVMALLAGAWLGTGQPWLLVALITLHVETLRQFLPSIRLDGYYILSDLLGLPDLFMYVRPVLASLVPGRAPDPALAALRPATRRLIALWVVAVLPVLLFFVAAFVVTLPQVLPALVGSVLGRLHGIAEAARTAQTAAAVDGVVQIAFLALPVLGGVLLAGLLGGRLRSAARRTPVPVRAPDAPRPLLGLVVAAVPLGILGLIAAQAADQRPPTTDEGLAAAAAAAVRTPFPGGAAADLPDRLAALQSAALQLVVGSGPDPLAGARIVTVLAVVATALLVWPIVRRLGAPPAAACLTVLLAGAPLLLSPLATTAGPGALAAFWLVLAVVLVGFGPGGRIAAAMAALVAVVTAPPVLVVILAFAAHATARGQVGAEIKPVVARIGAGLLAAGALTTAVLTVRPGPSPAPVVAVLLAAAVLVIASVVWFGLRGLRPVATGAAAAAAAALVPGSSSVTLLAIAVPTAAVLAGSLAQVVVTRPARLRAMGLAALVGIAAATGPVVGAAVAPPGGDRLAAWVSAELAPGTTVAAPPLAAARLVAAGMDPLRLNGSAVTVDGPGRLLAAFGAGPGTPASEIRTADPGQPAAPTLTGNDRLRFGPAAERGAPLDPRLVATLVALAADHPITVYAFPPADGEPADAPRRTAVISAVDGSPVSGTDRGEVARRWLAGQLPPYRPDDIGSTPDGLTIHYRLSPR
ncbi:hypothetical protein GCM10009836_72720 [Pseudonocardia ailaonensis]|uniref:Peptide zinc metalloprotease protein n=1 Tax=Pseudonocardia ailaonensis TaxID=367279 RepID=A0ABN2NPK4_9PSEU